MADERIDAHKRDIEGNHLAPDRSLEARRASRQLELTVGEIVLIMDAARDYEAHWMELERTGLVEGFPKVLVNRAAVLKLGAALILAKKDGKAASVILDEAELWRAFSITRGAEAGRTDGEPSNITLLCKLMAALISIEDAAVIPRFLRDVLDA